MKAFDDLQKKLAHLEQFPKALEGLDGDQISVEFDPEQPASIENAVKKIERQVDGRLAPFSGTPMIPDLVDHIKAESAIKPGSCSTNARERTKTMMENLL